MKHSDNYESVKRLSLCVMRGTARVVVAVLLLSVVVPSVSTFAASTIFLVRHAERADAKGDLALDPDLSAAGKVRALHLAQELKDAKIVAIFTSEYRRTDQTAEPLAKSLGIRPEAISGKDVPALVARIRATDGNVLVVGHSNTLPQIIKALGVTTPVVITEADYDNLFVVLTSDTARLIRLHYR